MKTKYEFDDDVASICESTVSEGLEQLVVFFLFTLLFRQAALTEGCRLSVRMHKTDDWPLAEIVSIKELDGRRQFYVHYVDCKWTGLEIPCSCRLIPFSSQLTSVWTNGLTRMIWIHARCSFHVAMAPKPAPAPV